MKKLKRTIAELVVFLLSLSIFEFVFSLIQENYNQSKAVLVLKAIISAIFLLLCLFYLEKTQPKRIISIVATLIKGYTAVILLVFMYLRPVAFMLVGKIIFTILGVLIGAVVPLAAAIVIYIGGIYFVVNPILNLGVKIDKSYRRPCRKYWTEKDKKIKFSNKQKKIWQSLLELLIGFVIGCVILFISKIATPENNPFMFFVGQYSFYILINLVLWFLLLYLGFRVFVWLLRKCAT